MGDRFYIGRAHVPVTAGSRQLGDKRSILAWTDRGLPVSGWRDDTGELYVVPPATVGDTAPPWFARDFLGSSSQPRPIQMLEELRPGELAVPLVAAWPRLRATVDGCVPNVRVLTDGVQVDVPLITFPVREGVHNPPQSKLRYFCSIDSDEVIDRAVLVSVYGTTMEVIADDDHDHCASGGPLVGVVLPGVNAAIEHSIERTRAVGWPIAGWDWLPAGEEGDWVVSEVNTAPALYHHWVLDHADRPWRVGLTYLPHRPPYREVSS